MLCCATALIRWYKKLYPAMAQNNNSDDCGKTKQKDFGEAFFLATQFAPGDNVCVQ
jgi:hypothetical protein